MPSQTLIFRWAACLLLIWLSGVPSANAARWIETGVFNSQGRQSCVDLDSIVTENGLTRHYFENCNMGPYYGSWLWAVDCSQPIPGKDGSFLHSMYFDTTKDWLESRATDLHAVSISRFVCGLLPSAPKGTAKLWVKNETQSSMSVYIDLKQRCDLAAGKDCAMDLTAGNHHLRLLQRGAKVSWQDIYDYKDNDIVHCFARRAKVDCSLFGSLFGLDEREPESTPRQPKPEELKSVTNNTAVAFAYPIPNGAEILRSETVTVTENGLASDLIFPSRSSFTVDFSVQEGKKLKLVVLTNAMFQQISAGQNPTGSALVSRVISGSGSESVALDRGAYVIFFGVSGAGNADLGDVNLKYRSHYRTE